MERITKPLHLLPLHVLITAPIIRFSSPSALPAPTFIMPCTSKLNPLPPLRLYTQILSSICSVSLVALLRLNDGGEAAPSFDHGSRWIPCLLERGNLAVRSTWVPFLPSRCLVCIHDTAERKTFFLHPTPQLFPFLKNPSFIYLQNLSFSLQQIFSLGPSLSKLSFSFFSPLLAVSARSDL